MQTTSSSQEPSYPIPVRLKFGILERASLQRWLYPFFLLVLCATAYLPLIYRLGFYWDDWPSIWFLEAFGPESFRQGFSADRPLLAWVFMLTTSLVGKSPVAWQVAGVLMRWLGGVALAWTLLGIWPQRRSAAWATAILFTLYPGFSQQYISVTYANAFLVYAIYLFSRGSMLWAYRLPAWRIPFLALSLLAAGFGLFTTEYFLGLELLRPVLLWLWFSGNQPGVQKTNLRDIRNYLPVVRRWLPYLAIWLVFIVYRLSDKTPRAKITLFSDLATAPIAALTALLRTLAGDFLDANLSAWAWGLDPTRLQDFDTNVIILFFGTIAVTALLVGAFALIVGRDDIDNSGYRRKQSGWGVGLLLLGIVAFFVSGWPVWITNLRLDLLFPWDRLTLMTIPASALLVVGLLRSLSPNRLIWALSLGLLAGAAAGAQFNYRLAYRQDWLEQKSFLWQLVWRVPGLQPGTMLLTSELPFTYVTDNSLTAPINWAYNPSTDSPAADGHRLYTILFDIEARLGKGLPSLEPDVTIHEPYRVLPFDGNTSQALVLFYDPPRCLKVIDPAVDRFLPVKPMYIRDATPLSRLDRILLAPNEPARPPAAYFDPEPSPNWCYYFEKAELYNQAERWEQSVGMADRALKINKHFTEKNVSELNPFIEAYAHTGRWDRAVELTRQSIQTWDKMAVVLCDVWQRIAQTTQSTPERTAAFQNVEQVIQCTLPR